MDLPSSASAIRQTKEGKVSHESVYVFMWSHYHHCITASLHSPSTQTSVSHWQTPKHVCKLIKCRVGRALVSMSATFPDEGMCLTMSSPFSMHSQIQWYFTSRCLTWLWKAWSAHNSTAAELSQRRGVVSSDPKFTKQCLHSDKLLTSFWHGHVFHSTS